MRTPLKVLDVSLPHFSLPPEEAAKVASTLKQWEESDFAGFIRTVKPGSDCYPDTQKITSLVKLHSEGSSGKKIRNFFILGTGGSSLGGEAILKALHPINSAPFFFVADNNDPSWFSWQLDGLNPEETLFYVVSKSGGTPETLSQFLHATSWIKKAGLKDWKKHFVLCTDPVKGDLRKLATQLGFSHLPVPSPLGGRFSVLSAVGLFPAAFAGLNLEEFLRGAQEIQNNLPSYRCADLAHALVKNLKEKPITVMMPYSSQLSAFSRWFCQLWAESLGKNGLGFTPYPAIGTTDQHSQMQLYMEGPRDKSVILVQVAHPREKIPMEEHEGFSGLAAFDELKGASMQDLFAAEFRATRDALTKASVPNATIQIDCLDEFSLGALLFFWETTTAHAGAMMKINPFDQNGVEAAKILTKKYLRER